MHRMKSNTFKAVYFLLRYKLYGRDQKWGISELTYRVTKSPDPANSDTRLKNAEVDAIVTAAFNLWEEVTNLKFRKDKGEVHIEIAFEK